MFSRIRETVRILKYREPQEAPGIVFVERVQPTVSKTGRFIAGLLEATIAVFVIGWIAAALSHAFDHLMPHPSSLTLTRITGALGAVLMLLGNMLRDDIQQKIRAHLNLSGIAAPFFGHKLEETFRTLRG